jgi:hypothetical protein
VGQVEEGLTREGQQVEVVVSKYPVELLEQRKKAMEENVLRQKANLLEQEKARALDVIWRYA